MINPDDISTISGRVEFDGTVVISDEESFEIYFESEQWDSLVDDVDRQREDRLRGLD